MEIYLPLIIASAVKFCLVPWTKTLLYKVNWTPTLTKSCVYVWSFLIVLICLLTGLFGERTPEMMWKGLEASLISSVGAIGIHETIKTKDKYP